MRKKFKIIFLGCPKNLVDTEYLVGELLEKGFEYSRNGKYVFIQTCAFIKPALEESYKVIKKCIEEKRKGKIKFIGVGGCLPMRFGKKIKKDFSEIDLVYSCLENRKILPDSPRVFLTRGYSYIKISEGCNEKCSFCTIPRIRGRLRSREIEDIMEELKFLLDLEFKEIILISQSTGQYGKDIYGRPFFKRLLREIDSIKGEFWVRIMYMHPADIDKELLEIIKSSEKIVNYMDIPVQHFSDNVLKRMRRRGGKRKVIEALEKIREEFDDDFYIRTEIIVGFPGEKEKDFSELLEGIERYKIQRIAIFKYSDEKETHSHRLKKIPQNVVEERFREMEKVARRLMRESQKRLLGKKLKVLICEESKNFYRGRTPYDAPEIDFEVWVEKRKQFDIPSFYTLKVKSIKRNMDLTGEIC